MLWEVYIKDGNQATDQGQYAKALKLYTCALEEAEKFGPTDPRGTENDSVTAGLRGWRATSGAGFCGASDQRGVRP